MSTLLALAALLAMTAIVAGCAGGDDTADAADADVRAAVDSYVQAAIDGDSQAYCAAVTEDVRYQIALQAAIAAGAGSGEDDAGDIDSDDIGCETVIGRMFEAGLSDATQELTITTVTIEGEEAVVTTETGAGFTLQKQDDGEWLISQGRSASAASESEPGDDSDSDDDSGTSQP